MRDHHYHDDGDDDPCCRLRAHFSLARRSRPRPRSHSRNIGIRGTLLRLLGGLQEHEKNGAKNQRADHRDPYCSCGWEIPCEVMDAEYHRDPDQRDGNEIPLPVVEPRSFLLTKACARLWLLVSP